MLMHFPPATPLAIILFVALAFLAISTISTPVIKQIPLAVVSDVHFGVLGYCHDGGACSDYRIGYDTSKLFLSESHSGAFSLPLDVRHRLSPLLIVHPIAAFMTLIVFILATVAHFHSPSHSPRYLLAMVIFLFPTLLVTLLAFLVDILLFVPNMRWGSWIVLGSLVLLCASLLVTCAMRRMLVSRRATQKRLDQHLVEGSPAAVTAAVGATSKSSPDEVREPTAEHANHVGETHPSEVNENEPTNNAASGDRPYNTDAIATLEPRNTSAMPPATNLQQHSAHAVEGMGNALQPPEPWDDRQRDSYAMDIISPGHVSRYGAPGHYPPVHAISPVHHQETRLARRESPLSAHGSVRGGTGRYRGRNSPLPSTGVRGMSLPSGNGGSDNDREGLSNGRMGSRNAEGFNETDSGGINFSRPTSPREQQRFFGPPQQRHNTLPTPPPTSNNRQAQRFAAMVRPSQLPVIDADPSNTPGHGHVVSFQAIQDPDHHRYHEDVQPMFAQGGQIEQELPRSLRPGNPDGEFSYIFNMPTEFDPLDAHDPSDDVDDNELDNTDGVLPLLEHYDVGEGDHDRDHDHYRECGNVDHNANASTTAISHSNSTAQETATIIIRGSIRAESRNGTGSTTVTATTTGTDPGNGSSDGNTGLATTPALINNMNMGMVTPSLSSPEFSCVDPYPPYLAPSQLVPVHYQPAPGLMHMLPVGSFAHPRFPGTSSVEEDVRPENWDCLDLPLGSPHYFVRDSGLPQSYSYDSMPRTGEYNGPNAAPGGVHMLLRHVLRSPPNTNPQAPQQPPPSSPFPPPSPMPYECGAFPSPSLEHLDHSRTMYSHSPSPSLSSHFTSISQREINPRWRPEYDSRQCSRPMLYDSHHRAGGNSRAGAMSPRDELRWRLEQHQLQQTYRSKGTRDRLDVLLEGNPDFELVVGKKARQREAERGGLLSPRVPADKGVLCGVSGKGR
ncbi:regulator of ime2 [Ascosphaera aggregata]|nr:regulator of ime2 [Ascosphaera aggregata]